MTVVYWSNIPAPYVVGRLNALAERGNLDFEAWFSARTESDRSWSVDEASWRFPHRYLPGIRARGRRLVVPAPLLSGVRPELVIGLHAEPAYLITQPLLRRRGVRSAFWLTPTYDAWIRRRKWKEAVKRFVFQRVDAVLTTGSDGRAIAMRYGTAADRIFTLPHFTDFEHFAVGSRAVLPDREAIRAELGLSGVTFAYVGRLWTGKGVDYLLDAFRGLERRHGSNVSLLLAGDGPDEGRLRHRCKEEGLRNVVFAGFRQRDELPRIYTAADVFVFPTLGDPFGHVVEEAMSCALPVLSTSAAGEIRDRVRDGENGFIVPPADSGALLARMEMLANDRRLRDRLARTAAETAADKTSTRWAEEFERVVAEVLSLTPVGSSPS